MSDFRKARIVLNAAYKDGTTLKENYTAPARVSVLTITGAPDKYRELSLRMVVDTHDAEELLEGICCGEVFLSIERIIPLNER